MGTCIAPVRGSTTVGVNRGVFQSVVLFSRMRDVAGGAPAEAADQHVEIAVAVEVGGAGVGGAGQPLGQRRRDERAVGAAAQPVDRAVGVVGRLERAEVGDEEVATPVLVEIDGLDVRRVAQARDRPQGMLVPGQAQQDRSGAHLAGQDVEPLVAVDVVEPDVGDGDGAGRRRALDRPGLERDGHPARRRPGLRFGQPLGRPGIVVAPQPQPVRRQRQEAGRPGRLGDAFLDQHHADDLVAPRRARQDVGRRDLVAGGAASLDLVLGRHREVASCRGRAPSRRRRLGCRRAGAAPRLQRRGEHHGADQEEAGRASKDVHDPSLCDRRRRVRVSAAYWAARRWPRPAARP